MSDQEHNSLNLESFLPYRLSILSNTVSTAIANSYSEKFGLSISEWRIIAVLARFPDIAAGDVAERTAMDKVAVSRAVRRLLDAGLIRRRTSRHDRRRCELQLSASGRTLHREIAPLALDYEQRLLSGLSASERRILDRLLDRLSSAARSLGEPES